MKCKKLRGRQQIQKTADLPVERLTLPHFSVRLALKFWTMGSKYSTHKERSGKQQALDRTFHMLDN